MNTYIDNPATALEQQAIEAGISINDLCDTAKIARSTFTRWKNGTNGATFSVVKKLYAALDQLKNESKKHKSKRS
jgi:predicted transcriptional regulator